VPAGRRAPSLELASDGLDPEERVGEVPQVVAHAAGEGAGAAGKAGEVLRHWPRSRRGHRRESEITRLCCRFRSWTRGAALVDQGPVWIEPGGSCTSTTRGRGWAESSRSNPVWSVMAWRMSRASPQGDRCLGPAARSATRPARRERCHSSVQTR
jgi:hypothetical protein